ncbi:hypothetical protein MRX96_026432 [Rhipicephalus microplus]
MSRQHGPTVDDSPDNSIYTAGFPEQEAEDKFVVWARSVNKGRQSLPAREAQQRAPSGCRHRQRRQPACFVQSFDI